MQLDHCTLVQAASKIRFDQRVSLVLATGLNVSIEKFLGLACLHITYSFIYLCIQMIYI